MPESWVVVTGGVHQRGGMDKANAALIELLLDRGRRVHIVAHHVDPEYMTRKGATVHIVPTPAGSFLLGEMLLDRRGRAVAASLARSPGGVRVVTNGGNCLWPDVVWVHSVHHEWHPADAGAPAWFRLKNRLTKAHARRRERIALRQARVVIANSGRTRRDVLKHFGVPEGRVHAVPLGADPDWAPPGDAERAAARAWLGVEGVRPVVAFVGALSFDNNKGYDTLWAAWRELCAAPEWDAVLVVAGGGSGVGRWRRAAAEAGLAERVRFLGFTDRVMDMLAGSDLLVSPARYEAYGLNVQEAVCRGVPAIVSACAGVAEQYPPELADALLADPTDARELIARLRAWRRDPAAWRERFRPLGERLRGYRWRDMAARILVAAGEDAAPERAARAHPAGANA